MLDESMLSIWTSVHGWFTPTVLFVVLNLVIGTIAVTSKALRSSAADDHAGAPKLARSPSLVLDRLRSFNLNLLRSHSPDPPLESVPAHDPETLESFIASPDPSADGGEEMPDLHLGRSQPDARPKALDVPEKSASSIKKSASPHLEEKEIAPPPAPAVESAEEDDGAEGGEVDARADDFINRFRQQLKLQRLDSLLRYRAVVRK